MSGFGSLHECFRDCISRRELKAFAQAQKKEKRSQLTLVHWTSPQVAWAIDDTHLGYTPGATSFFRFPFTV